ncbi:MAG: VanZ family protein [Vicinamibacterales bacterium]
MPSASRQAPTASLWLPVVGYMTFIFVLSSIANPPTVPEGSDKELHMLLYGGLGLLFSRALAGGWHRVTARNVIATTLFVALYGASDELHQYFNPPRNVEILDVVADTIGGGLASIGLYAWGIIQARDGL